MEQINFDLTRFYGTDLQPEDYSRLSGQLKKVYELMIDGKKRSTYKISEELNIPAASAHRHLSTLRTQYGFVIEKELVSDGLRIYWIAKKGNIAKKSKKLKPIGNPELFGAMMHAIYAYGAQPTQENNGLLSHAATKWAMAFSGEIGNIEYDVADC